MRVFLSLAAVALLLSMAWAQEPPPTTAPDTPPALPGQKKNEVVQTLETLLPEVRWPARMRGPLLLVSPERLALPADVLASARSREGLSLTTLAPLTKRKLERYGSLSVLAPLNMPVTGIPPEFLRMMRMGGRFGNVNAVLGTLTEAQWEAVISERGLGRENLTTDRQRKLWDSMLPPVVMFVTEVRGTHASEPQVLSAAQIGALRLRASRRLSVVVAGGASWFTNEPDDAEERPGHISAILDPELMEQMRAPRPTGGPTTTSEVPYQRKKTDLDPAQLDTAISLSGLKSIGELVARIARATGVELYVDRRLGSTPITVLAEPDQGVRAGDALAAVIRATATAIRSVSAGSERAFVLTHDRTPLAVSGTELSDSLLPVLVEQVAQVRQGNGARLPDVWDRIPRRERLVSPDSVWQRGEELEPKPIPINELPEPLRQRARRALENLAAEGNPPVKQETVTIRAQVSVDLVAPFWGGAASPVSVLPLTSFRRPPDLPLAVMSSAAKTRALQTALPRTASERTRLVSLAAERGFTTLFIPLSGDPADDALLAALASEAQARKLSLVPTLCPLQPAPGDMSLERDLSLTGRSATEMNAGRALGLFTEAMPPLASFFRRITERDFITPEAAPVANFARRVAALSALPGVTDIVLAEIVAPGYNDRRSEDFDYLWTGGATPAARLALLRRDGFDPMDISIGIMGQMSPPLFEERGVDDLLRKFRAERRDAYLKRLDAALKAASIRAKLWVAPLLDEGNISSREQYVSPWQGKLPLMKATPTSLRLYDHAAAAMEGAEQRMNGQPGDEEPNLTRRWLSELFENNKTQNFVLDFSDMPLTEALKLVEISLAKKAP